LRQISLSFFIAVLLLIFTVSLPAQDINITKPDSLLMQQQALQIFDMLLKAESTAVGYIDWEDFYVNDYDITLDYYDSIDAGDDTEFKTMVVNEISAMLNDDITVEDIYTGWTFTTQEDMLSASSRNSKIEALLWLFAPPEDHLYLRELIVKPLEE